MMIHWNEIYIIWLYQLSKLIYTDETALVSFIVSFNIWIQLELRGTYVFLFCRFFCAAKRNVDNDTARFDFDGSPRRWD